MCKQIRQVQMKFNSSRERHCPGEQEMCAYKQNKWNGGYVLKTNIGRSCKLEANRHKGY